jgi:alginate O-acetyltransferase complex protein AlgI
LGGNRKGHIRTYANLFIVFLLCGAWHGASWTFVIWGAYHGFGLVLERLGFSKFLKRMPSAISNLYVWLFVLIGWVIFRSPTFSYALEFLKIMFSSNANYPLASFYNALDIISISNAYILLIGIVLSFPVMAKIRIKYKSSPIWLMLLFIIFVIAYAFGTTADYTPFIYFRF